MKEQPSNTTNLYRSISIQEWPLKKPGIKLNAKDVTKRGALLGVDISLTHPLKDKTKHKYTCRTCGHSAVSTNGISNDMLNKYWGRKQWDQKSMKYRVRPACPQCNEKVHKINTNIGRNQFGTATTYEKMKALYLEHQFELLEKETNPPTRLNINTPYMTRCLICQSEKKYRAVDVKRPTKCRSCIKKCSREFSEKLTRQTLEQLFKKPFEKRRNIFDETSIREAFITLGLDINQISGKKRNIPKRLELDGYNEDIGLAFEHNGDQHYEFGNRYSPSAIDLNNIQASDAVKAHLCKEKGINLLVIRQLKHNSIDKIKPAIEIPLKAFGYHFTPKEWCDIALELNDTAFMARTKEKLLVMGDTLLTDTPFRQIDKIKVRCKNGHEENVSPQSRLSGHGCQKCSHTASWTKDNFIKVLSSLKLEAAGPLTDLRAATKINVHCTQCDRIYSHVRRTFTKKVIPTNDGYALKEGSSKSCKCHIKAS